MSTPTTPPETTASKEAYQVLARKYRPSNFEDLIGQDAMVRTLSNAFSTSRIAQAYMLTGVRGVGKTTTARILARALNYETGSIKQPSIEMPELGSHCQAIMESRHMDVLEMDAASNTGIDDIREIIESVRYKPVSARTKVYIIDEVHMLSKAAFNGLLKTLEEPPPHVKFIFATTEIQKVPVTVLSRCQRFDLRRVSLEELAAHYKNIAKHENVSVEDEALGLIARAAEGSVRDGLSILDQAIAHGKGSVASSDIRDMLGLADSGRITDLLEHILAGAAAEALGTLDALYADGAEAHSLVGDLASATHIITRMKIAGAATNDPSLSETARSRYAGLAEKLGIPVLSRLWQMLLKGLDEIKTAPDPKAAAEMLIIRLAHVSDLPSPEEIVRRLQNNASTKAPTGSTPKDAPPAPGMVMQQPEIRRDDPPPPMASLSAPQKVHLHSFADIIQCAHDRRELLIKVDLETKVRLVRFEPNKLELRLLPGASKTLIPELSQKLQAWTGETWLVAVSSEEGQPSLAEQKQSRRAEDEAHARAHPLVKAALAQFPDAEILDIRPQRPQTEQPDEKQDEKPDKQLGADKTSSQK